MDYRCEACASTFRRYTNRCSNCWKEGTLEPLILAKVPERLVEMPPPVVISPAQRRSLKTKEEQEWTKITTGIPGVDRVFGEDGFSFPSVALLGGGQGCGKSSLCLQICAGLAATIGAENIVYAGVEEPAGDVRSRVKRLGLIGVLGDMQTLDVPSDNCGDMQSLAPIICEPNVRFVVVDSISVLRDSELDTNDKGENLKRYAEWFEADSRANQRSYLLIARLNKEGSFYGVRDLEYTLDTIARIDRVDGKRNLRRLWCPEKNRCASTDNEAYLIMLKKGLVEVSGMDDAEDK